MLKEELKVLLIEDNAGDAFLIKFYLGESQSPKFDLQHAETIASAFEKLLNDKFDIILMDLNLPDSLGMETVKKLLKTFPNNLVIVLTGLIDEKVGLETVRYGAQDFLVKGKFDSKVLISSILFAFERYHLNLSLKSINTQLSEDTRRFNNLQSLLRLAYLELNLKTNEVFVSDFAQQIMHFSHKRNALSWVEVLEKIENKDELIKNIEKVKETGIEGEMQLSLIRPPQKILLKWSVNDEFMFGYVKEIIE
jgi:DNA-binding response OmpR family regulator